MAKGRIEINRRAMLYYLAAEGVRGGRIAEVGVLRGRYTSLIKDILTPRRLVLVDPWRTWPNDEFSDYSNYTQEKWDEIYAMVQRRFEAPGVEIMKMTSVMASSYILDGELDMVYLDANYEYDYVKDDLRLWFPKVAVGGWMCGHNYDRKSVRQAVDEFTDDIGATISTTNEGSCISYFWRKTN